MDSPSTGQKVRRKDYVAEGGEVVKFDRVGKIEKLARALSSDGKREVVNCHVRFPAAEGRGGAKRAEAVEIHESDSLELA